MAKKIVSLLIICFLRALLWFRYRVRVEGLERLNEEVLPKTKGGLLFLPNHPAYFVDPLIVGTAVWRRYPIRPMIVEYMFYMPVVHWLMTFMDALPVPNFHSASNSLKKKKGDEVFAELISGLKRGENFLVYPAGRVKYGAKEQLAGASGIHRILQDMPEANIVLVRTKGLWGSSFSRAIIHEAPTVIDSIWRGVKIVAKNLFFFTPRRRVTIELVPAPADFPRTASRLELNRYFEKWYNEPDGLSPAIEPLPGDSLVLVSYSMWGEQYLPLYQESTEELTVDGQSIAAADREKVVAKIARMAKVSPETIQLDTSLTADLGMDSLDQAELAVFLQESFDLPSLAPNQITTVKKIFSLISGQLPPNEVDLQPEAVLNMNAWQKSRPHKKISWPGGQTLTEAFLRNCDRMANQVACGDEMVGILTYRQLKMRALLLSRYLEKLPGHYVGILLPASVAANLLIFACQIAGKVPLMINWTMGPRHLEAVAELSGVQRVITSWAFLDRVDYVDFRGIEDKILLLEEIRREFSLFDKMRSWLDSRLSYQKLARRYPMVSSPDDEAVLLFTSGTESMPKGVPLSHRNITSSQQSVIASLQLYEDDVMLGILPPFHSFGFTVSGIMGLLLGLRVAYSPNPTEGKRIARAVEKWGATVMCGAPTFLKGMARVAKKGQLSTLRICVTGAEKAPPELFALFREHDKHETLFEGYGITECAPVISFNRPGRAQRGVGQPVEGVELCVVHPETFEPVKVSEQGLVLAHGANVFSGYLNPGTASPFVELEGKRWYKTGDLGYLDPEGYLVLEGRQKRFVKVGGEMISLAAIEESLLSAILEDGVRSDEQGPLLAVCGRDMGEERAKLVLFTRVEMGLEQANRRLRERGFSNLVKLTHAVLVPAIPIMGSGKIHYRQLESDYWPLQQSLTPD